MPLGLAKDSMINLAELAHQKDDADTSHDSRISLEDGEEEKLVMRLATHEIEHCDSVDEASQTPKPNGFHSTADEHHVLEEKKVTDPSYEVEPPVAAGSGSNKLEIHADSRSDEDSLNVSNHSSIDAAPASAQADSIRSDSVSPSQKVASEATSYGRYEGFSAEYGDYDYYGDYNHYGTPTILGQQKPQDQQPFWCCLFPWFVQPQPLLKVNGEAPKDASLGETNQESVVTLSGNGSTEAPRRLASKDDDETSTGSDVFGEKLSDKDRQAVLARLRLATPDTSTSTGTDEIPKETNPNEKGLLNTIVQSTKTETKGRSILKRTSTVSRNNLKTMTSQNGSGNGGEAARRRRSLFPSYETPKKSNKNLHTEFSPMARVLTVKSHKDMDGEEKGEIWWQRSDYEEFRKTGRMITKAMLQGGSEVWLATNQSWQLPNKDRQTTLKHAYSLAERQAAFQKGDVKAKKEYEETRDKWWHKFGHSRRGLEHIASIDEGRQRQSNVRTAIRAVVDEQRRQKVFHREDPDKLRMVSIQHTSWARDLAMAAGASDADAVRMNFDDGSRKSREFYLLKFSRSNQMSANSTNKASVPAFMKPALAMKVQPSRLDANTVSQIRFRQTQKKRAVAPAPPVVVAPKKEPAAESVPVKKEGDTISSMAKKAAGFASGEEVGNMSSVLTGMGPIPVAGRS